MRRLSRMRGIEYQVWCPPKSPLRVEYAPALIREIRLLCGFGEGSGVLLGARTGHTVRITATRRVFDPRDPATHGLDPVGIFVVRERGHVFLTETDLEQFERSEPAASVALVLAGARGGFFMRESDGSMLTIQSHREFDADAIKPARRKVAANPRWAWPAAACFALAAIPLMAHTTWRMSRAPLGLTVREESGLLTIAWNRTANQENAMLEIADGSEHRSIALTPGLVNAAYAPHTRDVEIRLSGEGRLETVHFADGKDLEAEARALRASLAIRRKRVAELESAVARLSHK
jgi:hypothetical protein